MENPTEFKQRVLFAQFELDLRTGELRHDGQRTILPEKPFKILAALLERPGEMVTREELIKRLWPEGVFVDFNLGLNKAVNRLREVLDDSADEPQFIETFPKRGYRFVARVVPNGTQPVERKLLLRSPVDGKSQRVETSSANPPVAQETITLGTRRTSRRTSLKWAGIGIVSVVTALVVLNFVRSHERHSPTPNLDKVQVTKLTDSGKVELAAISADGRYVGYAMREHNGLGIWLHQVATHSDIQVLPADAAGFEGLTFSPDGNHIYMCGPTVMILASNICM